MVDGLDSREVIAPVPGARPNASSALDAGEARRAAAIFEALLLREAFAPMAASLGFFGASLIDAVAKAAAEGSSGGFTAGIAAAFERAP
jgi:hypothetical protein